MTDEMKSRETAVEQKKRLQDEKALARRLGGFRVLLLAGSIALALDIVANLLLYVREGVWQNLAVAIAQLPAVALLIVIGLLVRKGRLDTAGYLGIIAIMLGFGVGNLFHAGLTLALGASGFLVLLMISNMVLPGNKIIGPLTATLFVAALAAIELLAPIPRYNVVETSSFLLFVIALVTVLAAVGLWQFARLLRFGTIRTRLLAIFVGLVLLPAVAVGTASSVISGQRLLDQTRAQLVSVAALKESEIFTWANNLTSFLALAMPDSSRSLFYDLLISGPTGVDSSLYNNTYESELERYRNIIAQGNVFVEMFILAPDGTVRLSTDAGQIGRNQFGYAFFEPGLEGYFVSAPYYDSVLAEVTMVASAPLVNESGETIGILAGRANLDQLNAIMSERTGLGETGETYLVGARDRILMTESRFEERGMSLGSYISTSDGLDAAVLTKGDVSGNFTNYYYVDVVGVYRMLEEFNLVLIAEQEQSEALRGVVQTVAVNVGVTVGAVLVAIVLGLFVTNRITSPIASLSQTAEKIAGGELELVAEVEQEDEIGALAESFNAMTKRLRATLAGLEQQVAERTAALAQRTGYLQASVDVSRAIVSVLDPDQLIQQVVELIQERFNLYYVGLFLVDQAGEWAVLRAGTGEAGQKMLARNHRIRVGVGMIGWCVANERPRIALRAELDDARLKNPDLPDTRSEAAIPLRSRGRVIGALTVQSAQPEAFDESTIVVFETMADQVAVALDNARLFRESQESLDSLNRAYGQITREDWQRLLKLRGDLGYSSYASGEVAMEAEWLPELVQAAREGRTVGTETAVLGVPIKVRDTVIGVIGGYKVGEVAKWTDEERTFLEDVADLLSVTLDSARSYQQVQVTAQRERVAAEVTARIRRSLETETILRSAAEELRRALGLPEVVIQLGVPVDASKPGTSDGR